MSNEDNGKGGMNDRLMTAVIKSGLNDLPLKGKLEALDQVFLNAPDDSRMAYMHIRNKIIDRKTGMDNGWNVHEGMLIEMTKGVFAEHPEIKKGYDDLVLNLNGGFREGEVIKSQTKLQAGVSKMLSFMKKAPRMIGLAILDNVFGDGRTTDMMVSSAIASAFMPSLSYEEILMTKMGHQGKNNLMSGLGYKF